MILLIITIAIVLLEVLLRVSFGFGNPLLYLADSQIGYLLAPNQDVRRFGNRIVINEYSMRCGTVFPKPEINTLRVLMVGDSIVNGGWWTNQTETLSARVAHSYQGNQTVEVLNASANSWCPRNELAYLQRFGLFNSHVVVLVINTDDLFGTAPTSLVVGHDRNYPNQKPISAIVEVLDRYLLSAKPVSEALKQVQAEKGDRVQANLDAIEQIHRLAIQNKAEFMLAMTPLLREVTVGSRDYELKARSRLLQMTQNQGIRYLDFLPILSQVKTPQDLYRDHIHLSAIANRLVSSEICKSIKELHE